MTRLRRRTGTKELLHTLENLVVMQPKKLRGRWSEAFGNDRPIHVELGMGKGRFISQMSLQHPHINFIGIDMYDELIRKGSEKAEEARSEHEAAGGETTDNLRLALGNIEYIEEMFAPGEIERIYLNFSDPWPKTRHAHRRLTYMTFLQKYKEILNRDGEIHMKTDSRSLFEFSLNSFAEMEMMVRNISLDMHGAGPVPNNVMTEYEMKFASQGINIHRVEVIVGERAVERRKAELAELRERRGKQAQERARAALAAARSGEDADAGVGAGADDAPAMAADARDRAFANAARAGAAHADAELAEELAPPRKGIGAGAGARKRAGSILRVDGSPSRR
ncbi:tRNA (guanosine(46)-N7)-methyltransferase TrmB [Paenibacillus thermotolerans]|uniref:tRNA (guanosine(46)-N7)-methyltransferase TrmB n=1 Tax=Paenibacillus thermotolerans TaxID=3027807 RepID=UPI003CC53D1E